MLELKNVTKAYGTSEVCVPVLKGINLTINEGEFAIIYGPSGSGKTTLLNIMGTLEKADHGEVFYQKNDIQKIKGANLTKIRQDYVGFIFQSYNLFENLTVKENVMMGGFLANNLKNVNSILESVGLGEHLEKFPYQLSGGQQQRVAIARALAKKPKILFCDEPTGALDSEMSLQILDLLQRLQKEENLTIVMVTHDVDTKAIANKLIYIKDGKITKTEEHIISQNVYSIGSNS